MTDGSYDSLRHKSVVTADLSDVDSVKVTLEDKDYTIDLSKKKGDVVSTYDGEEIEGTALGINAEGCLMIKDSTGKIHDIFTGEVSLRKIDNSNI